MQRSGSLDDRSSGSMPRLEADAEETFRAFTETVEALALQKSVIGESSVNSDDNNNIQHRFTAIIHCSGQHLQLKNCRILLVQSFTARMPLLMATSTFVLGRIRWSCTQQCYVHCLKDICDWRSEFYAVPTLPHVCG